MTVLGERLLATRPAQLVLEKVRAHVIRWVSGDIVFTDPGPPIVLAEQPTQAKMRVHHGLGEPSVRIGRFCSIHETVTLVTGSEHPVDAVSTYLFYWKLGVGEPEQLGSRGPITIGNDVWMGRDALVMSGVTIGDGAVVAARAVVTRDVAPYEIVAGVPARHIRWRFEEHVRDELMAIAWWAWPLEQVLAHHEQIGARDVERFIARHRVGGRRDPCPACEPAAAATASERFAGGASLGRSVTAGVPGRAPR